MLFYWILIVVKLIYFAFLTWYKQVKREVIIMDSVPLEIRLPNPGLPPAGFPPRPDEYRIHLPTHNHLEIDYKIKLPKYEKDLSDNSTLEKQVYKLTNSYCNEQIH